MPVAETTAASPAPLTAQFIEPHRNNVLIHYLGDVFDWHGYVKFLSLAALRETSLDVPVRSSSWNLTSPPSISRLMRWRLRPRRARRRFVPHWRNILISFCLGIPAQAKAQW